MTAARSSEGSENAADNSSTGHDASRVPKEMAPREVADTSYLMPFGVDGQRVLLKALYPGAVQSPETVRAELIRLAGLHRDRRRMGAATAILARGTAVVYVQLDPADQARVDQFLDDLHADAVSEGRAEGSRDPASSVNAGEAACMVLAENTSQTLLCNDNGARRVATANDITTRTTADDLVTLVRRKLYTPNQMMQIARRMVDLNVGDTITGPGYFRRPP